MAGVPVITLPFIADQPALSAYCTFVCGYIRLPDRTTLDVQVQHIGIQLDQLSSGLDGLTLGSGVHIQSTDEAVRTDLYKAWTTMRGPEGEKHRKETRRVREAMRRSVESGGSRQEMLALGKYSAVS